MEPIYFMVNGIEYVIRNVAGNRRLKEIARMDRGLRVANQKQFCRDYGIIVSTDAGVMNTQKAIRLLIERLPRGVGEGGGRQKKWSSI